MLDAHPVREPPHRKAGANEVMKLPGAVLGRGVVINVIVNVALVDVGTNEKLVLALCPAHGRFIADFVCHLRPFNCGGEENTSTVESSNYIFQMISNLPFS